MKSNIVAVTLDKVLTVKTAHEVGGKKVLIVNNQCESNLTQVAIGNLKAGEEIKCHQHKTMEEFYFFMKGSAVFTINGDHYNCKPDSFIKIPSNTKHCLKATQNIQFIYWGISI